ncbi:MAG: DUF3465 domain-containing protein [Pseudomonadota bacterium]
MRTSALVLLVMVLSLIAGCGGSDAEISNDRLLETFSEGRTGIWVSGQAPVTQILGDESIGGNIQSFVVRLKEYIQVTKMHSLDKADRIPIERGDTVRFHGLYDWNPRGGVVSLTHRDSSQPGDGGWVEHAGTRYD